MKLQSNKTKKKLKEKITKVIKRIDLSTSKKKKVMICKEKHYSIWIQEEMERREKTIK